MADESNGAAPIFDLMEAYENDNLFKIVQLVQRHFHMPDPAPLILTIATVVANRMDGSPVWLMMIGPPSSGKTALISSTIDIPHVVETSTLTEAALLSGTANKDRAADATGGLMMQIGQRGLLVMKDFTSVLAMPRDTRSTVLAALREIFDGRWKRSVGTDGAKQIPWEGKMGLLAGVTEAIERHHSVIASMGDRFLYYRMPEIDRRRIASAVLGRKGDEETQIQRDIRSAVTSFVTSIGVPRATEIKANDKEWLTSLALITADSRGATERDSYGRGIIDVQRPESPGRLAGCFGQLFTALGTIGCSATECRRLLRTIARDCIPRQRVRLASVLASSNSPLCVDDLLDDGCLRCPKTAVRRTLEDMECFRMVEHVGTEEAGILRWQLTAEYAVRWKENMDA